MADPYKDAPWQQGDILRADELNAMQAGLSPLGTIIPWALPYENSDGVYGNVAKFAPFHLPCTGGVYETNVAPDLAGALGHTFAPYTGGGWAEHNGEIVAFISEAEMNSVFPPLMGADKHDEGLTKPYVHAYACCFYKDYPPGGGWVGEGWWNNLRVSQWRWVSTDQHGNPLPDHQQGWGWHYVGGDGDLTEVMDHEIVGGEYLPKVWGSTGNYPMKAWSGSAWEEVSEDGVYEFDWEGPNDGQARRWNVVTHDGFVVPDFRGRSPMGTAPLEMDLGWGADGGPIRYTLLGERLGDKRLQRHNHFLPTNSPDGQFYPFASHFPNGGDPLQRGYVTNVGWDPYCGTSNQQWSSEGFGHNLHPVTGTNFLIFAGQRISDPKPMNDTRTRNGDVHRIHAVTTDKMLFQRLGDPNLSDEERERLGAQLAGEPWPPPVDEPPATRTTTTKTATKTKTTRKRKS